MHTVLTSTRLLTMSLVAGSLIAIATASTLTLATGWALGLVVGTIVWAAMFW